MSPHISIDRDAVSAFCQLRDAGDDVSIEQVPYEFQRGGNQMMRIRRATVPSA